MIDPSSIVVCPNCATPLVVELSMHRQPPAALYTANTDRNPRPVPTLGKLGPAGTIYPDPSFLSPILRVTDNNTRSDAPNRAFHLPSNAHAAAWSSDGRRILVMSSDGVAMTAQFDPVAMSVGPFVRLPGYVEPQFSLNDPNKIFIGGGPNGKTVIACDLSSGVQTTIVNLDDVVPNLGESYIGTVTSAGVPDEVVVVMFGGSQDSHHYIVVVNLRSGDRFLIDTLTDPHLGFHLHAIQIDKSGRYLAAYPSGGDRASNKSIEQVYLMDLISKIVTPMTQDMKSTGHDSFGYGVAVNQACCTSGEWDAAQWQFRSLSSPAVTRDLIVSVLRPKEVYLSDHTSWNNAKPDRAMPVISSTFRYLDVDNDGNVVPWRAWDDEIIAISTAEHDETVWRFGHHRSNVRLDNSYFWHQPIVNVSPDGKFAMFHSNQGGALGQDPNDGNRFRQDVFLIELK